MAKTAIMLGGNLPGTPEAMNNALNELDKNGFKVEKVSEIFHSEALDCVPGTPDFVDQAIIGRWEKSPQELLELCHKIETAAGRPRIHSSRESRILDLDIITFGDLEVTSENLIIPHPRAAQREFVLAPLSQIAPELKCPDGRSVIELYRELMNNC